LILEVSTIRSERELVMNKRQLSKLRIAFMNGWLYYLASQMLLILSWKLWMICLNLLLTYSLLFTLMIFLFITRIKKSIVITCKKYFKLWRIRSSMLIWRSVNSLLVVLCFWVLLLSTKEWRWILRRLKQFLVGHILKLFMIFRVFMA